MTKFCKNGHPIGTVADCLACRCSRTAKERWKNPSKAMLKACKNTCKSLNTDGLKSEEAQKKRDIYFASDLHRQRARAQALKQAEERRKGLRLPIPVLFRDTKPELAVKAVLEAHRINFTQQFPLGPYSFDFCLTGQKILIEVQGDFWHSQPKNEANDKAKFTFTQNNHPEYKIIYILESHTLTKNGISTVLNKFLHPTKLDIDLQDIVIEEITKDQTNKVLDACHYLPRLRKNARALHGIVLDNKVIGVMVWSAVSHSSIANKYGLKRRQALELARFGILPGYNIKNLFSYCLSRSTKKLKDFDNTVCLLVSYADSHFGHDGHAYLASNWVNDGSTKAGCYYVDNDRNILHHRTLSDHASKISKTPLEYAAENGFVKVNTPPKKRFIYWLREKTIIGKEATKSLKTKCLKCGEEFYITPKALNEARLKHDGYLCHPCSMKKRWEDPEYRESVKTGQRKGPQKEKIQATCKCGKQKEITQTNLNTAIKKHGQYLCMSCAVKKAHESGAYKSESTKRKLAKANSRNAKSAHAAGKYDHLKKPKNSTKPIPQRVDVVCGCGKETNITKHALGIALRKHGRYLCMSCAIKKAHADGNYND